MQRERSGLPNINAARANGKNCTVLFLYSQAMSSKMVLALLALVLEMETVVWVPPQDSSTFSVVIHKRYADAGQGWEDMLCF
ncbi:hypothetical protein BDW75DRAFT_222128 [Aspergillus navahoensis]